MPPVQQLAQLIQSLSRNSESLPIGSIRRELQLPSPETYQEEIDFEALLTSPVPSIPSVPMSLVVEAISKPASQSLCARPLSRMVLSQQAGPDFRSCDSFAGTENQ